MILRLAERPLQTLYGEFTEVLYYDGLTEISALVFGDVRGKADVLCRVHSVCLAGHYFNSVECDCREQFAIAQQLIQKAGQGVIILLNQEGRGNGHFAIMKSHPLKAAGKSQTQAYLELGYREDSRDYLRASEILAELGVQSVVLLTDNPNKLDKLRADGLKISGTHDVRLD